MRVARTSHRTGGPLKDHDVYAGLRADGFTVLAKPLEKLNQTAGQLIDHFHADECLHFLSMLAMYPVAR